MTHNFSVWIKGEEKPYFSFETRGQDLFSGNSITKSIWTDFYECSVTYDSIAKKHDNNYYDRRFFTFRPSTVRSEREIGSPTGVVGCHGFRKAVRVYSNGNIEHGYYSGHDNHDSVYGDGILYFLYKHAFQGLAMEFFYGVDHRYAQDNDEGIESIVCFDKSQKLDYKDRYIITNLTPSRNPLLNTNALILLKSVDEREPKEDEPMEFTAFAPSEYEGKIFDVRSPKDVQSEKDFVRNYMTEYLSKCVPSLEQKDLKAGGLVDRVSYRANSRFDPDEIMIHSDDTKALDLKYPNIIVKMGLGWALNSPRTYVQSDELLRTAYRIWRNSKRMDQSERVTPKALFDENIRVWIYTHLMQYISEQYPSGTFPRFYMASKIADVSGFNRDIIAGGNDLKSAESNAHRSIRWFYEFLRKFIYVDGYND